jgi:uncharacterized protein YcbK (DUF882 family)
MLDFRDPAFAVMRVQKISKIAVQEDSEMSVLKRPSYPFEAELSRRHFLRLMAWTGLISCSSKSVLAAIEDTAPAKRFISLYNPNTKESFNGVYWRAGNPVEEAVHNISHLLRDIRTDDVKAVDVNLLDLIAAMSLELKTDEPFHVICGYRSPKTNDLLRRQNKGVAKNSFHIKGQAADIRLPGQKTDVLRKAAYKLKMGGVGYYPNRRFVHIDVGPVRYWNGKR